MSEDIKMIERIANNERNISVIQKENEMQNRVFVKFEETVEKLQDLTESMHRLITIHDERIRVQATTVEQFRTEMNNEIKELESRISKETQTLSEKLDRSEDRIMKAIAALQEKWEKEQIAHIQKKETISEKIANLSVRFESWKWFILGGVFTAGVILEKSGAINGLFSLFKFP